jgi:hypothetical protein
LCPIRFSLSLSRAKLKLKAQSSSRLRFQVRKEGLPPLKSYNCSTFSPQFNVGKFQVGKGGLPPLMRNIRPYRNASAKCPICFSLDPNSLINPRSLSYSTVLNSAKIHSMKRNTLVILSISLTICLFCERALSSQSTLKTPKTLFVFHTDEFWLNLHHFLYVLARAQNKEKDASREAVATAPADQGRGLAKLNAKEQEAWQNAVAWYAAAPAKKDIVFDDQLSAITNALVTAADANSLSGSTVDPAFINILESVGPIYRKAWWKQHRESNRHWQQTIQALVDRHGAPVLAFVTNAYKLQWPRTGFHVHVSGYANWAGAYSTKGNLLVLASQDASVQGSYGLETIFHEGMHQWDDQVFEALRAAAIRINKRFPPGLSHSLIFFTAGEAVRRVIPDHVPYAERFGIWQRGMEPFKVPLEETWKRYLDGHGTRDEAFEELIKRTAVNPPKK